MLFVVVVDVTDSSRIVVNLKKCCIVFWLCRQMSQHGYYGQLVEQNCLTGFIDGVSLAGCLSLF